MQSSATTVAAYGGSLSPNTTVAHPSGGPQQHVPLNYRKDVVTIFKNIVAKIKYTTVLATVLVPILTANSLTVDAKKLAKPSARIAAKNHQDTKLASPDNQRSTPWQTDGQQHNLVLSTHGVAQNIVYYQTNTTGNVDQALNAAIAAWNNLGVIQLVKTNDITLAAIQITSQNNTPNISVNLRPSASYYGGENHLANALVEIPGNIRPTQTNAFSQTLTQTIGKALGFNVDNQLDSNNQPDIMNEKLAQYHGDIELGIRQVRALKQHYQINA